MYARFAQALLPYDIFSQPVSIFCVEEYCQSEYFQPRCLKNEVIFMRTAIYGRMRIGKCISAEEVAAHKTHVGDDPRYLGCSEDVLRILDEKCSGKVSCDVRVIEISDENIRPCFPGLKEYLEASFDCINSKYLLTHKYR